MPLPFQGVTIGALNNYAAAPGAFGQTDIALGQEVAAWVALAVGNADMIARTAADLGGRRAAMASRAVIEQAKGTAARLITTMPQGFGVRTAVR